MSDLMKVGADWGGGGTFKPLTSSISGAQRTADAHARFFDAVLAGRVHMLSAAAAAPTAYVGAAGGTPLLCIHNPIGSGRYANLLAVSIAQRATATGAGTTGLNIWGGVSVLPTGTVTQPRNAFTLQAGGSTMQGHVNTALTGSTGLSLLMGLYTHYWATAAAAFSAPGLFLPEGLCFAGQGNQLAVGLTVVPTTVTVDVSMWWEETPALITGP